jgi:serine/threonine protein kinase/Flp pilus assembly protein TadD
VKQCPMCDTPFPDGHATCPTDGAILIEIRDWSPGTLIRNKYRILAKIGQGGMGTMYKAQHVGLEEVMGLKVMASNLLGDPSFVKRFRQEARAARRLQHRNVVQVNDFDQADDGSLFIAMEYVDGPSLRKLLEMANGPLPFPRAVSIFRGIAEGIGAAHDQGLIHRDIKPENILLGTDSHGLELPKVADFGIVAMKDGSMSLSRGLLLTPSYASPEQWSGMKSDELDQRADVYSLGITFYEMLAGRLPFREHTTEGWMRAHLHDEPPPPSRFNPALKESALDHLLARLLAKDREHRPGNVTEILRELDFTILPAALTSSGSTGTSVSEPSGKNPKSIDQPVLSKLERDQGRPTAMDSASLAPTARRGIKSIPVRVALGAAATVVIVFILSLAFKHPRENPLAPGDEFYRQHDYARAAEAYSKAVRMNPKDPQARKRRAYADSGLGKYDVAIQDLGEGIRLQPDSALAFCVRGSYFFEKGEIDAAIQDLNKAIALDPSDALAFASRCAALNANHRYDDAIRDCTESIRLRPKFGLALSYRGEAFAGKGLYDRAVEDLTEAILLNSDELSAKSHAGAIPEETIPKLYYLFAYRGFCFASGGNDDRAIQDYTEALRLQPQDESALVNRGVLFSHKANYDRALRDFTEAIQLNPRDARAVIARGNVFYNKHNYPAALRDYNEALKLEPKNEVVIKQLEATKRGLAR